MDQRAVERRADVLVFSSPPLTEDLEVTGPVRVVLYACHIRDRYGFHRQAGGCLSERRSAQPDRRYPAVALSSVAGESEAWPIPVRFTGLYDRCRRHQQRVSERTPRARRNFEQQFPALRSQPEYRPADCRRDLAAQGAADHLSRPRTSIARDAAGDFELAPKSSTLTSSALPRYVPDSTNLPPGAVAKW